MPPLPGPSRAASKLCASDNNASQRFTHIGSKALNIPNSAADIAGLNGASLDDRNILLEICPGANSPSTVTELVLFDKSGSGSKASTVAVLVIGPTAATVAVICSVAEAPLASVPMVHWPVLGSKEPWLDVALTKMTPDGSWSADVTPVAVNGPLL